MNVEEGAATGDTDEQFRATVVSANVIDADAELWAMLERFLGHDPVLAWRLIEVTHAPEVADGAYTGQLVSSAVWKRDPSVPTPPRTIVLAESLDAVADDESSEAQLEVNDDADELKAMKGR